MEFEGVYRFHKSLSLICIVIQTGLGHILMPHFFKNIHA
jgi:hypothetical protein